MTFWSYINRIVVILHINRAFPCTKQTNFQARIHLRQDTYAKHGKPIERAPRKKKQRKRRLFNFVSVVQSGRMKLGHRNEEKRLKPSFLCTRSFWALTGSGIGFVAMEEEQFERLLDLFPVVRTRSYCVLSSYHAFCTYQASSVLHRVHYAIIYFHAHVLLVWCTLLISCVTFRLDLVLGRYRPRVAFGVLV